MNSASSNSKTLSYVLFSILTKRQKDKKTQGGENCKPEKDEMKIQFNFSFWLTCRLELKCSATICRGLKDRWIFALNSAELLKPASNAVPQERWSAVTLVKRQQKRRSET